MIFGPESAKHADLILWTMMCFLPLVFIILTMVTVGSKMKHPKIDQIIADYEEGRLEFWEAIKLLWKERKA